MDVVKPGPDDGVTAIANALVSLSVVDLVYSDQYLDRAEKLLEPVCTREDYVALRGHQERIARLSADLRHATDQGEWSKVGALAQEAAAAREHLAGHSRLLPVAEAVYGPRRVHADAMTLALSGVVSQPDAAVIPARDAVVAELEWLADNDTERAEFYRARAAHFQHLRPLNAEGPRPDVNATDLRQRIIEAVEKGDFARVQRLAGSVPAQSDGPAARMFAPRPREDRSRKLAAPFPPGATGSTAALGLTTATLPAVADLNRYLSRECAAPPVLPDAPISSASRCPGTSTCSDDCPAAMRPALRESLDLLLGHPFISSAGTRYLPWFGTEVLLVESFPESDLDARTELLRVLGLPRRHGLSRLAIEDALLTRGPRICRELGLDPTEFTIACIPFDAYLRLAPEHGWGQQECWTHFDGYQVTRQLHLWALVGGNARYGGPDDLSSLARDYDSERVTARFAIVRRERFLVRDAGEDSPIADL